MKEKKIKKITLMQSILIIIAVLAIIFGIIFFIQHILIAPHSYVASTTGSTSTTTLYADTFTKKIPKKSNVKYTVLHSSGYGSDNLENFFVTSNEELKTYLLKYFASSESSYSTEVQEQDQTSLLDKITVNNQPALTYFNDNFFENNNLAVQMSDYSSSNHDYSIVSVTQEDTQITVNIEDDFHTYGGDLAPITDINFIVLDKSINHVDFDIYRKTTNNSFEIDFDIFFVTTFVILIAVIIIVSMFVISHNKKVDNKSKTEKPIKKIFFRIVIGILVLIVIFFGFITFIAIMMPNSSIDKPIIYLYPANEEEVSVKLLHDDMITVSYPKYTTAWNVLAKEDGSLIDLSTNRNLYSLYYECESSVNFKVENDGFIVKGKDVATFLEEKLDILGLTERESEEFIVYWLPKLEANKYNYIRFATLDEINANMPLEINPNPDTVIRVLMTFKGLEKPIKVQEQQLTTPERNGFVAVEWGGTEIK